MWEKHEDASHGQVFHECTQDALKFMKVWLLWVMYKETNMLYHKGDVWSSESELLKSTGKAML